ncbi:hypothetical protein QUF61_05800 [Candidatus Venteria ishoeyi]|uniref:hypothetical protein n=1 Tax=Candidatus Venteria ishoeyi TaxID=1899563 RepID=UPI0025A632C7|nr:hypothetical protein [Candidatus Venteria ishoeyi]MDM8545987.1 hypothetical protein [Candidatus Venteria ishoeyi]
MNAMMKPIQAIALLLMILSLAYALANRFAPAWLAEAATYIGSPTQWSEKAKRDNPVAYLRDTEKRLQGQQEKLQRITRNIRNNLTPLETHIQQHNEELAKTSAFLKEGRKVYLQAVETNKTQKVEVIKFAGRMYPGIDAFKSQLALLHTEKQNKETLLEKARQTKQHLNAQLYAMLAQSSKVEMAKSEIGPRIMIAEAAKASTELDNMIAGIDQITQDVLTGSDKMMDDYNPIGMTKDLLESSRNQTYQAKAFDADFEAFLSEGT